MVLVQFQVISDIFLVWFICGSIVDLMFSLMSFCCNSGAVWYLFIFVPKWFCCLSDGIFVNAGTVLVSFQCVSRMFWFPVLF